MGGLGSGHNEYHILIFKVSGSHADATDARLKRQHLSFYDLFPVFTIRDEH